MRYTKGRGECMKALLGALAALLVLCIVLGVWARSESKQNAILVTQITNITLERDSALSDLKKFGTSCTTTDTVVGGYTTEVEGLDSKALDINRNLDASLLDLQQHQDGINETEDKLKAINVGTNAVLSDSMWNTYCEVQPTDSDCTSRRIAH